MDPFRTPVDPGQWFAGRRPAPRAYRDAHEPALFRPPMELDHQLNPGATVQGGETFRDLHASSLRARVRKSCSLLHRLIRGQRIQWCDKMTTRRRARAQWTTGFMDAIQLLGVVMIVPVAILLVGAPVALAIALAVWVARTVMGTS
jgi:hypothetical protein